MAWTAIATGALVAVTLVYVVVTGRIARHSGKSAEAAERSAKSAERAADATTRAVAVAEAGVRVDFEVSFEEPAPWKGHPWIKLVCRGDRVFLHRLRLQFCLMVESGGEAKVVSGELPLRNIYRALPFFFHRDEFEGFGWPFEQIRPGTPGAGLAMIEYSVDAEGPRTEIGRMLSWGTPNEAHEGA